MIVTIRPEDNPDPNWCPDCGEPRGVCRCEAVDDFDPGEELISEDFSPDLSPDEDVEEKPIPWCEEHRCQFEVTDRDPPGYEFYACPECEHERDEALGLR